MSLTLHKECSLQPRFSSAPGYGSAITFADVARHRIRQSELLEALQHLFNLRFHTEQATRTVRIEPADDFFAAGPAADWRAKTDFSQPVVLADIAPEVHERRTWRYLAGDGAVARFDAEAESPFGQWSVTTGSRAAKEGEKTLANPLFCPTISTAGGYSDASSAVIMQVGDRDDVQEDGTNFTPRIVRFAGMHPLPDGERWGFPSGQAEYPLAAFHFAGDGAAAGFTLCFEDRDGVRGLHRYYDLQTGRESAGRRITLSLRLAPHEFESLFTPGTGAPDLRSAFLLDTGEGTVRAAAPCRGRLRPAGGLRPLHLHPTPRRMTTRHKKRLAAILLRELGGLEGERAVERLFELGLVNLRVCEQRAVRNEIERLGAEGVPRCEAMHATAELFCCSYEKIRSYYYNSYKS